VAAVAQEVLALTGDKKILLVQVAQVLAQQLQAHECFMLVVVVAVVTMATLRKLV
jgi:hypothetical protein